MPDITVIFSAIFTLVIVLLVFYATYVASKWLTSKASHLSGGKYMRVLETIPLGKDKFISLVEASGKIMMLGVSGQSIQTLTSINPEELKELIPFNQESQSFQAIFSELVGKKIKKLWKKPTDKDDKV